MKHTDAKISEKAIYETPKMESLGSFETLTQGGRNRRGRHRHRNGCHKGGYTFS